MFFGLEVKANSSQAKPLILTNTLKLSQAVLEPLKGTNGKKEPVSVMVEYGKKQFLLCVLDPNIAWNCPLDLLFEGGSQVKFFLKGNGTVHLTGYENFDDLDDMSMSMSSDSQVSTDDEKDEAKPIKAKPSKEANLAKKAKTNGVAVHPKKSKVEQDDDANDASDDDDDDFEVDCFEASSSDGIFDDEESEDAEDEEMEDEDDDDDDVDDDEDDEDIEEEEEEYDE